MNRGIVFSIITIFICASAVFSQSKWLDKGEYKELKASDNSILKMGFPLGDSVFCIFDKGNVYKKFDLSGNLLLERQLIPQTDSKYFSATNDVSAYIDLNIDIRYISYLKIYYTINKLINIETDSIIFNKEYYVTSQYGTGYGEITGISADYNNNLNECFLSCNYTHLEKQSLFQETYNYNGYIYLIKDTVTSKISDFQCMHFDRNNSSIIFTTKSEYMHRLWDANDYKTTDDYTKLQFCLYGKNLGLKVISENYTDRLNHNNDRNGFIPEMLKLSNINLFVGTSGNSMNFYEISDNIIKFKEAITMNYKPNIILFSKDDKYLILGSPNHTIDIYHIDTKRLKQSYNLNDSSIASVLTLSPDGTILYAGCSNGTIKMFDIENISSFQRKFYTDFDAKAFYNNSSRNINFKINLPEPCNVRIEVYDLLGRLVGKTGGWVNYSVEYAVNCSNNSGLLIYRIVAGNNQRVGKIISIP